MIYFIQSENGGLIKIGYTYKSAKSRLSQLQTGSPDKLIILKTEEGDEHYERELHTRFKDLRQHGEWFRPGMELISHIVKRADVPNAERLKIYARSYANALWSHFPAGDDEGLTDVLYLYAEYVSRHCAECWKFLSERGVTKIEWKHCQYFFAIAWPIWKPWMELSDFVLTRLIDSGAVTSAQLSKALKEMSVNRRPIIRDAVLSKSDVQNSTHFRLQRLVQNEGGNQ